MSATWFEAGREYSHHRFGCSQSLPFEATINRPGVSRDDAIEQIAHRRTIADSSRSQEPSVGNSGHSARTYSSILRTSRSWERPSITLRRTFGLPKPFAMTAAYDQVIADYFRSETTVGEFPPHITVRLERKSQLRYRRNPHQKAASIVFRDIARPVYSTRGTFTAASCPTTNC